MLVASLVFALAAGAAPAQATPTIDPGMSREQVVARLGQPLSSRSYDGYTYQFYRNGCEKPCGMNDIVVLDSGKVVDAVFRSSRRHYSGTSSSPRMISAAEARHGASDARPLNTSEPQPPDKPKKPSA
jgi:hypothetical protein